MKEKTTEEILLESVEEHLAIKRVIADLLQLDADDETFAAKIKVLEDEVAHHVEEEEETLFPRVERMFDDEALESLGDAMEDTQAELLQAGNPRESVAVRDRAGRDNLTARPDDRASGGRGQRRRSSATPAAGRWRDDHADQLVDFERLSHHRAPTGRGLEAARVGRSYEHSFNSVTLGAPDQVEAVDLRHRHVGDDEAGRGGALQQRHRGARLCQAVRGETFVTQHLDNQRIYLRVVIDHQHPPRKRHGQSCIRNAMSQSDRASPY